MSNVRWKRLNTMQKEYKSVQKYLVMGPRKLRLVVAMAKKLSPVTAVEKLPFVSKRATEPLVKVIKAAIAQARVQGVADTDLIFKEIQINEGPRLKRGKAASRGRYHPFKRRMSHIRVVLTVNPKSETLNSKETQKSKIKNSKKDDETEMKIVKKRTRKEKKS